MYNSGCVVAVKINGKTVEEKDGKVTIPFNSEYTLMLKNRNDRKAVARVYIDGDEVTKEGRLIIDANGNINLERYIDDMDKGKKFKFVPVSDNRVKDKGDSEKGCIEVRFQLVKPVLNNVVIHEEHFYHKHHHHEPYWYYNGPFFIDHPVFFGTSLNTNSSGKGLCGSVTSGGSNFTYTSSDCCAALNNANIEPISTTTIHDNHLVEERGATIKGSNSSQKFCYSYVGELESQETVIRFQLIGTNNEKIVAQYCKTHCTQCGKSYDANDNFCAKCGTKK